MTRTKYSTLKVFLKSASGCVLMKIGTWVCIKGGLNNKERQDMTS